MSKTSSRDRRPNGSHRVRLSIVPKQSGWAIVGSGAINRVYETRREAETAAKRLVAAKRGGESVVRGRDGRIRSVDTYALSAASFAKVSAVEGISLTAEMKRDFRALDRTGLSPEARRQWLVSKYGK